MTCIFCGKIEEKQILLQIENYKVVLHRSNPVWSLVDYIEKAFYGCP